MAASASNVMRLPTVRPASPILKPSKKPYPLACNKLLEDVATSLIYKLEPTERVWVGEVFMIPTLFCVYSSPYI